MELHNRAEFFISRLFGKLARFSICAALLLLFTFIAAYHFSIAATLLLEGPFGMLYARLIVASIYSAAALIVFISMWAIPAKPLTKYRATDALLSPRDTQMAALIKAAMVGYAMARKSGERHPSNENH